MSPWKTLISLTALASSLATAFASLEQGTYIINNVKSYGSVRSYTFGTPIFITPTREWPGPFQEWQVQSVLKNPVNDFTLKNVGLNAFAALDNAPSNLVVTSQTEQVFSIQATGKNGKYNIVVPGSQKMWTVHSPGGRNVRIEEANGADGQQWEFRLIRN